MRWRIGLSCVVLGSLALIAASCPDSNSLPVAIFVCAPTSGEAPLSVSFDAGSSYDADGVIRAYS